MAYDRRLNHKRTFRVSGRLPVYRFDIDLHEGRAAVVERLHRALEVHGVAGRSIAVDGAAHENDFAFRPLRTWFGSTRNRPRVQGHVSSELAGTSVHVSVRTDPAAWAAVFSIVAVLIWGTFQITYVPPLVSFLAAFGAAAVIAVMSHLAEGSRMALWVRQVVGDEQAGR